MIPNPGLLPFGLTLEDVRAGTSKLRNRVIGRVFKDLQLIEQWGSGIQRMTNACRDAGLADPALEEGQRASGNHAPGAGHAALVRPGGDRS